MSRRIVKTEECNCEPLMKTLLLPTTNIPLIGNLSNREVNSKYFIPLKADSKYHTSLKLNNEQGDSK